MVAGYRWAAMVSEHGSAPRPGAAAGALLLLAALLAGCGSGSGGPSSPTASPASGRAATVRGQDWTRFGYDAARTNIGPRNVGIGPRTLRRLHRRVVRLPGTVDSSPIYLHAVRVGKRRRDVFIVTTTYGRTLAIAATSGRRLWQFKPRSVAGLERSPQITNTTPVADPDRRFVYAASPDGRIHKLSLRTGREAGGRWPVSITHDPAHEKLASALNLSGGYVIAVTGGYIGDEPPYQGHVVEISRRTGGIARVFNTLCSDRRQIMDPRSCPSTLSAIWARAGAVVEPGTHRLLVTTGNGPFNGQTDWGNSVLELTPGLSVRQSYTPPDHAQLEATDSDLGSTVPALLPAPGGRRPQFALQGGKDGKVRLLSLSRLNGRATQASPLTGGELQILRPPRGQLAFTTPAVWRTGRRVIVLTADFQGTVAYELRGSPPRLHVLWDNGTPGSSPVLAGGLLYVYDVTNGGLNVYRPLSGRRLATLAAGSGHWNSPIVADGRIALPEGNANDHATSGVLDIYSR